MGKRQRTEDEGQAIDLKDIKEEPLPEPAIALAPPTPTPAPTPAPAAIPASQKIEEEEDDLDDDGYANGDIVQVHYDYVLRQFAEVMKTQAAGMSISRISELARDLGAIYELHAGMNRNLNCVTNKRQKIANSGTTLLHDLRERQH